MAGPAQIPYFLFRTLELWLYFVEKDENVTSWRSRVTMLPSSTVCMSPLGLEKQESIFQSGNFAQDTGKIPKNYS